MALATRETKLRPVVKTHGGKFYLTGRILPLLTPHEVYVEPFVGGANVLLNKPPAPREVIADVDAALVNLYRVLRDQPSAILARVEATAYSEATFTRARTDRSRSKLDRAVAFLVRRRMSRSGLGKDFAWSDRLRGGQPGDVNAWETFRAMLPRIAARLANVEVIHGDARDVIRRYDGPETLCYCDPPYLHSTRTVRDAYAHEMTEADHVALLSTLVRCRGRVILSGYPSALYDEALAGWERIAFDVANHSGQGKAKQRRTEVLWIKPGADA